MPKVYGTLIWDSSRENTATTPGASAIDGVPMVLQNEDTGQTLAVLTDRDGGGGGNYVFNNVPQGSYKIVTSWGYSPTVKKPGDFASAAAAPLLKSGTNPPLEAITGYDKPDGAAHVDGVTETVRTFTVKNRNKRVDDIRLGPVTRTDFKDAAPKNAETASGKKTALKTDASGAKVRTLNSVRALAASDLPAADLPTADLTVTVEADAKELKPGDTVTYAVTVKNNGPAIASGPKLSYKAPAGFTDVYFSTDGGYSWGLWKGEHTFADIAGGESTNVLIRGVTPANISGTVNGIFTVASPVNDPNTADNTATSALAVAPAAPAASVSNLSTAATSSNDSPKPGDIVTYTVTVKNNGPADAPSPVVDFGAPPALGNIEYSTDNGTTWQPWTGGVTLRDIPGKDSSRMLVRGEIPVVVKGGGAVSFTARSGNSDPDPADNTAIVSTTVTPAADLVTSVTAGNLTPKTGEVLSYTVNIHNNGPSTAQAPTVTYSPPSGLIGVEYSADGGETWEAWPGSAVLADLESGGGHKLLIRGKVSEHAAETIEMVLAAVSGTRDPNSANNTATSSVPVTPASSLVAAMTADNITPKPGDTVTYTVTIQNRGPAAAKTPTVTDTLPPQLTGGEFSADGGETWQAWPGSVKLPDLANGASAQVLIRAKVAEGATAAIANAVEVSSPNFDSKSADNAANARAQTSLNGKCCTVRFYCGSRLYSFRTAACGAALTPPPQPVRCECEFNGWFTDCELSSPWDFITAATKDMTLYAGWTDSK